MALRRSVKSATGRGEGSRRKRRSVCQGGGGVDASLMECQEVSGSVGECHTVHDYNTKERDERDECKGKPAN